MSMKQSNSSHHRRNKFDLSKEEETLLNIAYDEYNDLFSQILLLKKNYFLSSLQKFIQISLIPKNIIYPTGTLSKILNIIEKNYYDQEYNHINEIVQNISNIKNADYYNDNNFIPHCNLTNEPLHTCGNKFYVLEKGNYLLCLGCKKIYHSKCVHMKCEPCDLDYYTKIELEDPNKKDKNINPLLKPATWIKYHCNAVINDVMKCPKCHNTLYINKENKKLSCISCKYELNNNQIKSKCLICKEEFLAEAKVYNPLEYKKMKMAMKTTLFNGIEAKPDNLPCGDLNQMEMNSYKFLHKKECNGVLYQGVLNKKKIVVCSKCHMLNFYEYHFWLCPICHERFRINSNGIKEKKVIRKRDTNETKDSSHNYSQNNNTNSYKENSFENKNNHKLRYNKQIHNSEKKLMNYNYTNQNEEKFVSFKNNNNINNNFLKRESSQNFRSKKFEDESNSENENSENLKSTNYLRKVYEDDSDNSSKNNKKNQSNLYHNIIKSASPVKKAYKKYSPNLNEKNIKEKNEEDSSFDEEEEIFNVPYHNPEHHYSKSNYKENNDKGLIRRVVSQKENNFLFRKLFQNTNEPQPNQIPTHDNGFIKRKKTGYYEEININLNPSIIQPVKQKHNRNHFNINNSNSNNYNELYFNNNNEYKNDINYSLSNNNYYNNDKRGDINNFIYSKNMKAINIEKNYKKNDDNRQKYFNSDEYNVIKQVGEGTFGKIYEVEDKHHNRFAMKKILANTESEMKALQSEYSLVLSLGLLNLNLVKVYGIETKILDKTTFAMYVLMDLAKRDWEKEIMARKTRRKYYSEDELIRILKCLVTTFAELQRHNIAHRDIKPQNILLFDNNEFKIADFGEAKELINKSKEKKDTITQTIRGTELYMSPILFYSLQKSDNSKYIEHNVYKSDVFSLGLCFLLAATLTFNALCDIRELSDMISIKLALQKYLKSRYSERFMNVLYGMLEIEEKNREDFIELEEKLKNL